ncbi:N-hydroxyarylamine O-acetyltransferase [Cryomyces antarcticus]|uniref:Arylamine N-acetyltransferase n=1 Tax=Cryomyces antarcticus TaxID=329879 RepID=A0ABR0M917_9PEZI|nr:hypothetical protein LTR60_001115 [Cryomyces antarcticus]KAK5019846.1 hypothetical protein LTR39_000104 [Cryomyces antarcticus]KAK5296697.1 hypothetical protein LTR16_000173 [Cryomyces antarcticus]
MSTSDPSERPTYTAEQMTKYYDCISLPSKYRHELGSKSREAATGKDALSFLAALQRYQLASVPFENLELHYSPHHIINIEPEYLFHKIVERGTGRGGYCMENNCLFGTVLRSLGFDVYSAGARVSGSMQPQAELKYTGWSHMINIVTIQSQRYFVDVGFGASGPTHPIPLIHDRVSVNVPPQTVRLNHTHIPDNTSRDSDKLLWVYEHRNADDAPWTPTYCFTESEFLPMDFAVMSHHTSTSKTSWFTYKVICTKMLMDSGTEQIVGDVTLFETAIKKRIAGKAEALTTITSEEERVRALEKYLGVKLSEAERTGIQGMASEVK